VFKRLQNIILTNLGVMLILVAGLGIEPRSIFTLYEPDIPDCLKR
jgi:cyclic lactone autoinducer peptide